MGKDLNLNEQWLSVVPKRAIEYEDGPSGGAVLLVPRFRKGILAKWLQPRLKRPFIRVKLDELGSFVWRRMDGLANFESIRDEMKDEFGEHMNQAEDRLKKFLTILRQNEFAELYVPASQPST
jgi:hypothetical protein